MTRPTAKNPTSHNDSALSSKVNIADVIRNQGLASAVAQSIRKALRSTAVHICGGTSVRSVFNWSLNAAIRDIAEHPRGQLIQRLIRYGTPDPDDPELRVSDGQTILSDAECGLFVDFVHSFMISHFKGELAELLALDPCIRLTDRLRKQGLIPKDAHLYWGGQVQERSRRSTTDGDACMHWGGFTKGADGILVSQDQVNSLPSESTLAVHGIIEVKSYRSVKRVLGQIERHRLRLEGGVRLGSVTWQPHQIRVADSHDPTSAKNGLLRVIVFPSRWKLSRQWRSERVNERSRVIAMEEISNAPVDTDVQQLGLTDWRITLAWSEEALTQAAYQMTLWYLAQVGAHVFARAPLPREIDYMTPEEAGINQIKYRLYVIGLRYISERQTDLAMRLYNDFAFGSPLALDNKSEMLWPSDFPHQNDNDGTS